MGYRRHVGRRLIVQLDGETLDGVLQRADRRTLTLRETALVAGDRRTPIDGLVVIERARIAWAQVP
ncbi:hypothetical protein [Microtetraspora niveoalba]|uniref:hypothetical protein n=1 Tax=Microtetraspora niveoalba TaxID=46175 RepID=UPI000836B011|nr:hypothetical protein [Microtetraspora niveoalba]